MNLRHVLLLGVCAAAALDESILLGRADREAPHCRKVKAAVAVVSTSENCTSPIAFCSTGTVRAAAC